MCCATKKPAEDFPLTLDLRRPPQILISDGKAESQEATRQAAAGPALLAHYRPLAGVVDEMIDAVGQSAPGLDRTSSPRSTSSGPTKLGQRFERADQYLRDAGVYYREYDGAGAKERDWPLAHVPLLIDESEWADDQRRARSSAPNCSKRSSPTSMATTSWCSRACCRPD